jgi:hypothetical protein
VSDYGLDDRAIGVRYPAGAKYHVRGPDAARGPYFIEALSRL